MRVAAIGLENFRSYEDRRVDFGPGVTAFVGPNGAGKTNILEAVHVIARGESSRAGEDTEMIRWGAPLARVTVEACRAAPGSGAPAPLDRHRLEVTLFGPAAADARRRPRRYTADGAPRRADDVIGTIAVVAFFPEDTDLLASAPSARRRYMDAMIAQVDRSHRADTRAYANVLTQRNALLRAGRDEEPVSESEIAFWDTELVRLATAISLRREAAVRDLRPAFRAAAAALGADPAPDIAYAGQVQGSTAAERAEGYRGLIALKRDRERWQATTLVGPHREDLAVAVAERPLPTFASRGEQRSAVLALKLAEAEWIRAHVGEPPIFLFDDVLSELDTAHREALCQALPDGAQALLTAAVLTSIPEALRRVATVTEIVRPR
ncbi:MAG: DNA replication and repair protein RecF [Chloroflexi bacterium]|nr:MAG: DNA replication and repair protein RecF [Chloroflexota bacterium]